MTLAVIITTFVVDWALNIKNQSTDIIHRELISTITTLHEHDITDPNHLR